MSEKLKNIYDIKFKPVYEKYMAEREGVKELSYVLSKNKDLLTILDEHELRNVTLMLLHKNDLDVKYANDLNSKLNEINNIIINYNEICFG